MVAPRAADIVFQTLESFTVAVAGDDNTPVLHELCAVSPSARNMPRILSPRFRIEKLTGDCSYWDPERRRITGIESGDWQTVEFYKIERRR